MRILKTIINKKFFVLFYLLFSSGCLFDTILSYINQQQESRGTPIASLDGTTIYRGARRGTSNASMALYLEKIDPAKNVTTVAGNGTSSVVDGVGTAAGFKEIRGLAVKAGSPDVLYVADECTIRTVNTATWQVSTLLGVGSSCTDIDGVGAAVRFNRVNEIIISGNNLYVASDRTVRLVDLGTLTSSTIAGDGGSLGYVDGTGVAAKFSKIGTMVLVNGNLFAFDSNNQRIRKISLTTSEVTTVAGSGAAEILDGIGVAAKLGFAEYNKATTDNEDIIFFTDGSTVRKFKISTSEVTTILGSNPDDAEGLVAGEARSFFPKGIAYSIEGLYISNFYGISRLR